MLFSHLDYNSLIFESKYSSELTTTTQRYYRDCGMGKYYYETIKVNVQETGYYTFGGISTIDTYGYIYQNNFNPFNPKKNLIAEDGCDIGHYKFNFIRALQANITYIMVVTTFSPNIQGNFSVVVSGPSSITLNRTSKRFYFFSINHTILQNI